MKDNREHKFIIEIISQIEKNFDVNSLQYKGLLVWPWIRLSIWTQLNNPGLNFANVSSQQQYEFVLMDERKEQLKHLRQFKNTEIFFFSRPEDHSDWFDGKCYNRHVDSIIDFVRDKYRFLKFEFRSPQAETTLPRLEATFFQDVFIRKVVGNPSESESISAFKELQKIVGDLSKNVHLKQSVIIANMKLLEKFEQYFSEILFNVQPKAVFLVCYYSMIPMALIRACKKLGIVSVDIQHGKQGKYHGLYSHWTKIPSNGYDLLPDVFWCWGSESKHNIEKWQPNGCLNHKALVGGNCWLAKWVDGVNSVGETDGAKAFFDKIKKMRKVILVTLQPFEDLLPLPKHVLDGMRRSPNNWLWLIRLHPLHRNRKEQICSLIQQQGIINFEIENSTICHLYSLLRISDHHITYYSSVCYEALAFNVSTTIVDPSGLTLYEDYINRGIFNYAMTTEELLASIEKSYTKEQLKEPCKYIETSKKVAEDALGKILNRNVKEKQKPKFEIGPRNKQEIGVNPKGVALYNKRKDEVEKSFDALHKAARSAGQSLKIMQVHVFYDNYLNNFYKARPHLFKTSYEEQMAALLKDGFSGCHMLAPYLNDLGCETQLVIANCAPAQSCWARQNDVAIDHSSQWVVEVAKKQIEAFQPDVLYLSHPVVWFDSRFTRELSWKPTLIVGWRAAPVPKGTDWSDFDLLLSHSDLWRRRARELGARATEHFFPGFPAFLADTVKDQEPEYDVVFCGQLSADHAKRVDYLRALGVAATAPGREIDLGYFTLSSQKEPGYPEITRWNQGARWGIEMHRAIKSGRLALNIHVDWSHGESRTGNMRLFETTGTGSFLLTDHFENIGEYFEPGKEVETFRNEKEMVEKVYYYLDHPDEREAIARRGQKRCLDQYSMEKRALEFDSIIRKQLQKKLSRPTSNHLLPEKAHLSKPMIGKSQEYLAEGSFNQVINDIQKIVKTYPRRVPGKVRIDGKPFKFVDLHSFFSQALQIFGSKLYSFKSNSPSPLIIDCGAHIGLASLFFETNYPNATILAYEADPAIGKILEFNVNSFGMDNVEVHKKAIWTHDDGVNFHNSLDDSGYIGEVNESSNLKVPTVRLRTFLGSNCVDLLKLDIEGAEYNVISDCNGVLSNAENIIIESHKFRENDGSIANLLQILENNGFDYVLHDLHPAAWLKSSERPPFSALKTKYYIITVFAWQKRRGKSSSFYKNATIRTKEAALHRNNFEIDMGVSPSPPSHIKKSKCGFNNNKLHQSEVTNFCKNDPQQVGKIVHLCMQDFGGAANAAYRLHKGLKSIGFDSTMAVLNKVSNDPTVKVLPDVYENEKSYCLDVPAHHSSVWKAQVSRWNSLMRNYPNRPKGLEMFTDALSDVRLDRIGEIQDADIINLHWVAGMADWPSTPVGLGCKPVVWTLHDMNPFTGGCHYAGDCRKYIEECGACPQLGSAQPDDLSHKIWNQKYEAYQNLNLTLVTPSRWLAGCAAESKLFSRFPVHVIPYGFPLSAFRPYSKPEIRKALNLPNNAKAILFGAHSILNKRKGFEYLLNALNQFPVKNTQDVLILTFGAAPKNLKIPSRYSIRNLGMIQDEKQLAMVYSASDVYVIPTLEDNLPNTVVEAMACGVPVVGFDIGGMPDMIVHKQTGYLVKPKDIKGLIEGIEWVFASIDGGRDFVKDCRAMAEKEYSLEKQANAYLSLYKEVAKKDGGRKTEGRRRRTECSVLNLAVSPEELHEVAKRFAEKNRIKEAIGSLRVLLQLFPDHALAHNDLGVLYYHEGDKEKAFKLYQKASELEPENLTFRKNLADFYYVELKQVEEALRIYHDILEKNPEDLETLLVIGQICVDLDKPGSAVDFYQQALEADTGNETALEPLRHLRKMAAEAFLSADDLSESFSSNAGVVFRKIMKCHLKDYPLTEEEQDLFSPLLSKFESAESTGDHLPVLLAAMMYYNPHEFPGPVDLCKIPDWLQESYAEYLLCSPRCFVKEGEADRYCDHIQKVFESLYNKIQESPGSEPPGKVAGIFVQKAYLIPLYFRGKSLTALYAQRAAITEAFLKDQGYETDFSFTKKNNQSQKMRIGIYARVISRGTETFATLPVYKDLNRDEFEIFLYVHQSKSSELEGYTRNLVDRFIELPKDMKESVDTIRSDDLDVLFFSNNLTAVMNEAFILANHRLARKQCVHFCQPVTTGLKHIDCFFLGDLAQSQETEQSRYNEQIVTLEGSGICFDVPDITGETPVSFTREQIGIKDNQTVFVSGANFFKIIPELRDLWTKLLSEVTDSVLVLYPFGPAWSPSYPKGLFKAHFQDTLAKHDVKTDRLVILDPLPSRDDIKAIMKVSDVYLDAVPYSGATSLLDPLEMAVPPVVLEGDELRFRQGAAILKELGVPELVVTSEEEYLALTARLAADDFYRQGMAQTIRKRMQNNPPFLDTKSYALKIGNALKEIADSRES